MKHLPYNELSERMGEFFGTGRCFLLAKGRVGLYVGLRAMGLPPGSKVLIPGYTCMVVPSAVRFAGLEPAYTDIDPKSYNLDPQRLESLDASTVSAIIVQHTYGIPCDMRPILRWAAARNVAVIEDCCHAFGSRYEGRLCGTFGRFAFMSGQWNKPISTGLGGMLLVNDPSLADRVARIVAEETTAPGLLRNLFLRAQILAHTLLVKPTTAMKITAAYRALNSLGLVIGSSSQQELRVEMPRQYLTRMAPCQARQGLREMARIEESIRHRIRLTALYQTELPRLGFAPLSLPAIADLPLLRYPVRVANKDEVLARANESRVEIGSWFETPLHPAGDHLAALGYRAGMCPEGEAASREVINLPTHRKVGRDDVQRTLDFLRKHGQPKPW